MSECTPREEEPRRWEWALPPRDLRIGCEQQVSQRVAATWMQTGGWDGAFRQDLLSAPLREPTWQGQGRSTLQQDLPDTCLLYTSDAADDC